MANTALMLLGLQVAIRHFSPQHWRAGTATTCDVELRYVQFYMARTVFGGVAGSAQLFPSTVFNATLH